MPNGWQRRLVDLDAIENRLKNELADARANYDRANLEFNESTARAPDLGPDTMDGSHLLHKAASRQKAATAAYEKAVDRFCNFILLGVVPGDEKSQTDAPPECSTKSESRRPPSREIQGKEEEGGRSA